VECATVSGVSETNSLLSGLLALSLSVDRTLASIAATAATAAAAELPIIPESGAGVPPPPHSHRPLLLLLPLLGHWAVEKEGACLHHQLWRLQSTSPANQIRHAQYFS